MSEWKAGFDYSCAEAAFAVLDENDQVVFDEYLTLQNRNAAELPLWLESTLADHKLTLNDITEWSVGAGPGSFTGLRLASSFVMGIAFRRNVKRRCVSTASAIASTAKLTDQHVLTLYDGKKNEILGFGLEYAGGYYQDDHFTCVIRTPEDLDKALEHYTKAAQLAKDYEAVRKVLGDTAASQKVLKVDHLSAVPLILACPGDFSRKLTDLVYLRPAVFVEPRPIRTNV